MKKLQQLCLAAVFTLTLTTASFAGHIDTGGKTEPPPPPPSITTSSRDPETTEGDENQLIEDIAFDLFRIMLSVF